MKQKKNKTNQNKFAYEECSESTYFSEYLRLNIIIEILDANISFPYSPKKSLIPNGSFLKSFFDEFILNEKKYVKFFFCVFSLNYEEYQKVFFFFIM